MRILRGDPTLEHAEQSVRRWLCRRGADESLAEDVVQAAVLLVLRLRQRRRLDSPAWLRGVAFRLLSGERRRLDRRLRHEAQSPLPRSVEGPEEAAARAELVTLCYAAVGRLREPYRSTLEYRFVHDLQPVEIARLLDLPAGTVRARLKRGLDLVRRELAPAEP